MANYMKTITLTDLQQKILSNDLYNDMSNNAGIDDWIQKAVDGTVKGLNSLNANLSSASKAAQSISVPSDLSSNAQSVSDGLSLASSSIEEINKLYQNLGKSLSQVNSATNALDIPEGIGEELEKMKNTIKELNAKYEAMLGAMNK